MTRHTDHLGSTSVLSDANGQRVANSDVVFAPYGEIRLGNVPVLTDFGYTGQRHDGGSGGLMYFGSRYYLPGLRRFISPDTIVPGVGSQAYNRYSYSLNNPINLVDPSGHAPIRRYSASTPSTSSQGTATHLSGSVGQFAGADLQALGPRGGKFRFLTAAATHTCETNPNPACIMYYQSQLDKFNVDVNLASIRAEFPARLSAQEWLAMRQRMAEALLNVLLAVKAIAARLEEVLRTGNATDAFNAVFHPTEGMRTTIIATDGATVQLRCNDPDVMACNQGDLGSMNRVIYIEKNTLIGGTSVNHVPITGIQLLVHEFGHTFTNPLGERDEATFNANRDEEGPNYYDFTQHQFAETATESNSFLWANPGQNPSEITANAFMNWVFGTGDPDVNTILDEFWELAIQHAAD